MRNTFYIMAGLGLFSVLLLAHAENSATGISGRLFMSAEERQRLEADRSLYKEGRFVHEQTKDTAQQLQATEYKYNGILVRQNGTREIWVNGLRIDSAEQQERKEIYQFQSMRNLNTTMALPEGGKIVLRPGQRYQLRNQKVMEAYQAEAEENAALPSSFNASAIPPSEDTQKTAAAATVDKEPQKPATQSFDESALSKEISKIRLLEERIQELEKKQGGNTPQ